MSIRAWSKTESLFSKDIVNDQLRQNLADPWAIVEDVEDIYAQSLTCYAESMPAERFAVEVTQQLGCIRLDIGQNFQGMTN
ncbi:MAG: hypothetical protein AAFW84_15950 [Cyanobacteria bacterium J06635_15]